MAHSSATNQINFDKLLDWLDSDRKNAAEKYESIRQRLTRIFFARGCYHAEELADETIERVTKKVSGLINKYEGDPAIYFYAVGKNVFLEWTRKPRSEELSAKIKSKEENTTIKEIRDKCLTKCMQAISNKQSEFILEYYRRDKQRKIELRKKLADELGITPETLRVRAYRIRSILQKCVLKCVESQ